MSSTVIYCAIVERIPGTEFCVRFPDFPEVQASDATIEDVALRGARALRAHIDQLIRNDEGIPRPTPIEEVKADSRNRHGFLVQIDAEVPESRLYTRRCRGEPPSRDE